MTSITQKQAVSLLYFLAFAAMACAGRFMALFFRDDLGLNSSEIGFVLASGTMVGLFSTPTWCKCMPRAHKSRTSVPRDAGSRVGRKSARACTLIYFRRCKFISAHSRSLACVCAFACPRPFSTPPTARPAMHAGRRSAITCRKSAQCSSSLSRAAHLQVMMMPSAGAGAYACASIHAHACI